MALSQQNVEVASRVMHKVVDNIETVIVGKREVIELVFLSLIAKGHVLIEDVPGTGKTSLASALAKSIYCDFRRMQFTPDVMPSDVTGFSVYNQKTEEFEFREGGVMSNLVLADEINRASAKTQSALLEAMEERQVTVDSVTHKLKEPFMVLATQNPIEQFGTYPLPEAQLDRFLVKLSVGYAQFDEETRVVKMRDKAKRAIGPVVPGQDIIALQEMATQVRVHDRIVDYIVQIVTATRNNPDILLGSSMRGSIALNAIACAYALYQGRDYVIPDDVRYLAPFVIAHRLTLSHDAKVEGRKSDDIVKSIISNIAVPMVGPGELR